MPDFLEDRRFLRPILVALGLAGCSAGVPSIDGAGPHARHPDASDSTDTTDTTADTPTEPPSRAGAYATVVAEQPVTSGSVRSSAVTWNGEHWVDVYVGVTSWFNVYAVALTPTESGVVAGTPVRVDDGGFDAFEAEIAADDDGTMLAVYEDDRVGSGTCCREIYARFLDPDGTPVGTSFDLTNQPAVEEYLPAVANDGGTWFVAWSDDRMYAGDDRRLLYGRTVGNDGTLGEELRIGGDSLWQVFASVAGSGGAGWFLTVWGDYDPVNGSLDAGYRARVVDTGGHAVTGVIDLARIGNNVYDRPAVAWNPWRGAWLVVWMAQTRLYGTWVWPDGTTADAGELAAPDDGAGSARLTFAAATNSFLLAYHAWWTYDGYVQDLDTDGAPVGDRRSVNAATPPLGTFYVPIAASDAAEALIVPSLDYSRITATLERAPE